VRNKSYMRENKQSDESIRPTTYPNKARRCAAEGDEARGLTEGNTNEASEVRTRSRGALPPGLERVRESAVRGKRKQFTALLHHVTEELLNEAYHALNRKAVPGVDEVTWEAYGEELPKKIRELHTRLHLGTYKAKASKRARLEKPDGGVRLLGISAVEDKIVQAALTRVLNAIYESDFLGFSYGFRPHRDPHQALDAVSVGIERRKINWLLDADIRGYFDSISHRWLIKFVEHRVGDRRIIRLIKKWLSAGVMDGKELEKTKQGTPQGATISPLLANVYLHYVFDQWAHQWRKRMARGDMIIVRYADDFVVGFQHRLDAVRFQAALAERLKKFELELHPDKTRIVEFGRFALTNRKEKGLGKPETFNFLGFTHICSKNRKGKFLLRRKTIKSRFRKKLQEIKLKLQARMHEVIEKQGAWLRSVLNGYFNYHAVPTNSAIIQQFRTEIARFWLATLRRRGQKKPITWEKLQPHLEKWLPRARLRRSFPTVKCVMT
jgi:RNA-directed DNA polymerase